MQLKFGLQKIKEAYDELAAARPLLVRDSFIAEDQVACFYELD